MLVVCKQLRCLMFRSEQMGSPCTRGPDPTPGAVGTRTLADSRGRWVRPRAPTFVVPHLKWCFLGRLSFSFQFCWLWVFFFFLSFFFFFYGAVYNLNILCTYPTQWVEQQTHENK